MKKTVFIVLAGFVSTFSFATNGTEGPVVEGSFKVQEEVAQFPGGDKALQNYFNNAIQYPVIAKQQGFEGKVIASAIVDENGKLTNIQIIQSVGGGCDEEVIRVLSDMPAWKPANQAGHTVALKQIFSFTFKL